MVKALDQTHTTVAHRMAEVADLVTVALDALLPRVDGPESRLVQAMRYAALGPGLRVRPYLAIETGRLFEVDERAVLRAACALECLHACSLIHNDLPAMGDDAMRGGRPTVHAAYNEAVGVLAGDALHSMAFEIMAHPDTHPRAEIRGELVHRLAMAAGVRGLVGGQMLDLLGPSSDSAALARMRRMKTGSLITFAVEAPLLLAGAQDAEHQALLGFARDFGVAYQIVEDLKAHDGEAGITVLGRDAAAREADRLSQQCRAHLELFGARAAYLRASVDFVLDLTT